MTLVDITMPRLSDSMEEAAVLRWLVVDLRTVRPPDVETIVRSVGKTNRLAVVEEGPRTGGWAGEVLASVTEEALGELDDAWRIATDNSPIPYSPPLEDAFLPGPERIAADVLSRS